MPVRDNREYRNLSLRAKEQENSYIVEGYATTYDQEYELSSWEGWDGKKYRFYEKVDSKAFEESDTSDVIFQYNHEGRVFARTSNNTLKLESDEHGLKVTADLGGTEIGRQLYQEIRDGYTTKMSFGFTIEECEVDQHEDESEVKVVRTITKINKLYDVSAVSIPANDTTEISARKLQDGFIEELKQELAKKQEIESIKLKIRMKGQR